jgi:hypothetical protein
VVSPTLPFVVSLSNHPGAALELADKTLSETVEWPFDKLRANEGVGSRSC